MRRSFRGAAAFVAVIALPWSVLAQPEKEVPASAPSGPEVAPVMVPEDDDATTVTVVEDTAVAAPAAAGPTVIVVAPAAAPASPPASPSQTAEGEEAQQPGTHFIAEVGLGATVTNGFGLTASALVGYGGTPFGLPTPLYLIVDVTHAAMHDGGVLDGAPYEDERRYLDLAVGLRLYVPILGAFRLFGEGTIGAALASSSFAREGFAPLEAESWYAAGTLGGGVQVRILHGLSLGARARVLFVGDQLADVRSAAGADGDIPVLITGSVTWHF